MSPRFDAATTSGQPGVVLIVGATSGIGRTLALRLSRAGTTVVAAGRRADLGEQLAARIADEGGDADFVTCDATIEEDVARAVADTVDRHGRLDGAVNNAGGVLAAGPTHQLRADAWRRELDLNLTSVFFGLKHQLPAIAAGGGGAIVNNASSAAVSAVPGLAAYTSAKHAVLGLTRSTALEWADRGVRVNALLTGNVDTTLYRSLLGVPDELPRTELSAPNPTGRVADPDEIARLMAYLLSDAASFITGAAIPIDGGMTAR